MRSVILACALTLLFTTGTTAAECVPRQMRIAVDAGHGPKRPGATSATGQPEYSFNLALAREVVATLRQAGFSQAFLLDPQGLDLAPGVRGHRATTSGAGLLVSIHHDAAQPQFLEPWTVNGQPQRHSERFAGYSLFYSARNPSSRDSLRLAGLIGRELRQAGLPFTRHHAADIPGERRTLVDDTAGVYRYDGLAVLHQAAMPAVLLEAGVIVNKDEEVALSGSARQRMTALAVTKGIVAFCRTTLPAAAGKATAASGGPAGKNTHPTP